MSKVTVTESYLEDIGDAIRGKLGTSQDYTPGQMAAAIESIPTGGITPTGTISITQNGTADVTQYASAAVNVPNSYAAGDEGKVVQNGALVAQTSETVTQNGTYDTTTKDEIVVNVQGGSPNLQDKTFTQNGVYTADAGYDGFDEVTVNVSGGGVSWKDQLATNWDFSNPVNTRGNTTYRSSSLIYTIDGWQLQGGELSFVTGGIKLERYAAGTAGFFMQRFKAAATSAMVGKQFTLTGIVDGVLGSMVFTMPSANSGTEAVSVNGVYFRIWNYGTEVAITIDIAGDTGTHVVQALKMETGSSQTLATQTGGAWVLNNSMDAETEYIKARSGMIYNS